MNPRRTCRRTTLIAGFFCCWTLFVAAADQPSGGARNEILIFEAGEDVKVLTPGAADWVLTKAGQALKPGFRVRTGPNSRLTLKWSDNSVMRFRPLTEIEILPPHAPDAEPGLHLFRGFLSFFHRDAPGRVRVITRAAAAGIRGTEFAMAVDAQTERATVWVMDGGVELTNNAGPPLVLTNGQAGMADVGQPPRRAPGFITENILQWCFYYPGVIDLREVPFSAEEQAALGESLKAYREGDLLAALQSYTDGTQPPSAARKIYHAAVLLSVGEVEQSETVLADLRGNADRRIQQLAGALRNLIAAVKRETISVSEPRLTSELLAASYYEQSRGIKEESLKRALRLARAATANAPEFGFAWTREAELEFSFGRTGAALEALEKGLALSPRNAQALALKGFLLAARNQPREAITFFDRAIAIDAALGNAWLGRGLCRIRGGDLRDGREDLLVAAALEPRRAALRSYLGKAYAESNDPKRALHELELAKEIDANDPTAWLYSALVKAENNRINEAIRDLEHSQELNDNRRLYRSSLLLDQDKAVRSVNLALLYDDAGLADVALREASRSIAADYGDYSAHLFLANSYLALRNESPAAVRFETPAVGEFLLALLLGPADGQMLAQFGGHQLRAPLFERNHIGLSTTTEYLSSGAWSESTVQYGSYRNSSYAVEGDFLWDPGETPHRENERRFLSATLKHQLTPQDGLLIDIRDIWNRYSDIGQRYNPDRARGDVHTLERQEPNILAGLDHQWNEANHTLFLVGRAQRSLDYTNRHGGVYLLTQTDGQVDAFYKTDLTERYESESTLNTIELQHFFVTPRTRTIGGLRFQEATDRVFNRQTLFNGNAPALESYFGTQSGTLVTNQVIDANTIRVSPYLYEHWQVLDPLWLIAGVSYDYERIPANTRFAPVSDGEIVRKQISPKAGFIWTPGHGWTMRGAYSQSLGGVDLDQNVRLEPTQLAGFIQSYRTLFPVSLVGPIAGAHLETYDLSLERNWPSNTYAAISGQFLRSTADQDVGAYRRELFTSTGPGVRLRERLRSDELSLRASVHQLLGDYFSVGVRYEISDALLHRSHPTVTDAINIADRPTTRGMLQNVGIDGVFRHPIGFFAKAGVDWWSQDLSGLGGAPGEDFWQLNISAGYRFTRRRAEITVGVLNVTDRNYRLHPINLYPNLARERTFYTRLDLNF